MGFLSDEDMQNVMLQTKLDKGICAKVWELSNPDHEDKFSKTMFMIAMHLMYKKKKDMNLQLPSQIPAELISSADDQPVKPPYVA